MRFTIFVRWRKWLYTCKSCITFAYLLSCTYMNNQLNNKGRLVQFRVSEKEGLMLDKLCDQFGAKTSEYVRGLIRDRFFKVFPNYSTKKEIRQAIVAVEPQLTPEQYCEQKGGRVETVNGIQMCVLQISKSMQRKVPLSSVHTLLK